MSFQNHINLKTRLRRFLFVALLTCTIVSLVYQIIENRKISPKEYYFYTVKNGADDIRSPTKKQIISSSIISDYERYKYSCDLAVLASKGIILTGRDYRGIRLCNSAGFNKNEFEASQNEFEDRVDELYSTYYGNMAYIILMGVFYGFLAWLCIVSFIMIAKWVLKAESTQD